MKWFMLFIVAAGIQPAFAAPFNQDAQYSCRAGVFYKPDLNRASDTLLMHLQKTEKGLYSFVAVFRNDPIFLVDGLKCESLGKVSGFKCAGNGKTVEVAGKLRENDPAYEESVTLLVAGVADKWKLTGLPFTDFHCNNIELSDSEPGVVRVP